MEPRVSAQFHDAAKIGVVTLCAPPNNFLTVGLLTQVVEALERFDADSGCAAMILAAEGKHFCAGRDFSSVRAEDDTSINVYRMAIRLMRLTKPWAAVVQGGAIGAGLGLAMTADFRICGPRAYFTGNFVKLGLHHGFGLSVTLPRIVGSAAAARILMSGKRYGAEEALRLGMVDELADTDDLVGAALRFLEDIAGNPSPAVLQIRQTLRGNIAQRFAEAVEIEATKQAAAKGD